MAGAYKKFSLESAAILGHAKREECALGRNETHKSRIAKRVVSQTDELLQRFNQQIVDIDGRYKPLPPSTLCFPYMTALGQENRSAESEARTFFEWLHWERHHESAEKAAEADRQGNLSAWDRLARTAKDWRTIVFKKGSIKPFRHGIYHQDIFQFGLSFASGMENLTGEELAAFFDAFCPCKEIHDAGALQKQLKRLLKDLEAAAPKELK